MHTSLDMQRNPDDVVLQHSVKIAIVFLFCVMQVWTSQGLWFQGSAASYIFCSCKIHALPSPQGCELREDPSSQKPQGCEPRDSVTKDIGDSKLRMLSRWIKKHISFLIMPCYMLQHIINTVKGVQVANTAAFLCQLNDWVPSTALPQTYFVGLSYSLGS